MPTSSVSGRRGLATLILLAVASAHCASKADLEAIEGELKETQARVSKLEAARPTVPNMPQQPRGPDAAATYGVPLGSSAVVGPKDAWVTIIEISDFQCPFCSRGATTIGELRAKYKDDVRVAFKHNPLPFHPRALPAAIAAECAGEQGKFWPMADALFADQGKLGDDDIKETAKRIGLEARKFAACLGTSAVKERIEADAALAGKFGARGTPAFFINGRFLSGAQPMPAFQALVEEELTRAKASGVSKADYYAKAIEQKGLPSL